MKPATHNIPNDAPFLKITSTLSLDQLLSWLGEEITNTGKFEGYAVNLIDESRENLVCERISMQGSHAAMEKTLLKFKYPFNLDDANIQCFSSRQPVCIHPRNLEQACQNTIDQFRRWELSSLLILPLCQSDKSIGTLMLFRHRGEIEADSSIRLLTEKLPLYANQIGNALIHAQMLAHQAELLNKKTEEEKFRTFVNEINDLANEDDVYELIAQEFLRRFPFDVASILIQEGDELTIRKCSDHTGKYRDILETWKTHATENRYRLDLIDGASASAFLRNCPLHFHDCLEIQHLPMSRKDREVLDILKTPRTFLCMPIRRNNKPIGILWLWTLEAPVSLDRSSLRTIEHLCSFVSTAILNARLYSTITRQKLRIEELNQELQHSVRRLDLASSAGNIGVWEIDLETQHLIWDDRMFGLYGTRRADFSSAYHAWQNGMHPDDMARCQEEIKLALRGEKDFDTEYRVLWPTGEVRHLRAFGCIERDGAAKPLRITGINYDITERKQSEKILADRLVFQQALLDSIPHPIFTKDEEARFIGCNRAYERDFGTTSAYMLGKTVLDLPYLPEHERLRFHAEDISVINEASQCSYEMPIIYADGETHTTLYSVNGFRLADGKPGGLIGMLVDNTERKRSEEKLREMNAALQQQTLLAKEMATQARMASAAKSEFLANMSHEIRTPLNGVIGMLGLVRETPLNEEQRDYLETAYSSSTILLDLLNDILDFSKIEAGKLSFEKLDFDLQSLLDDFANSFAVRAQEKGLELLCSADSEIPPRLRGDPGRLRQILANLTGNAIKFTPKGEVEIQVRQQFGTPSDSLNPVVLRFSVRDTGIGIAGDKIGLLFDKFTQADGSITRQYGGTGLGLAISKQLAEMMGGEIGVSSHVGEGSEFWFTVPLEKSAESSLSKTPEHRSLQNIRILVVDDNASSRRLLQQQLSAQGMRSSDVHDGIAALQALIAAQKEHDPFRFVLIDRQMPGLDGEALGRTIRSNPHLASTQMLLLTTLTETAEARHFSEIGFTAVLAKPVRQIELVEVLAEALTTTPDMPPQSSATMIHPVSEEQQALFSARQIRVLLAEDNITNQKVALAILKRMGLHADAVANGLEALRSLETLPYDLVLMDCQMPIMDGYEATRQIRAPHSTVRNRAIPVVAMTANAMLGDRERCLEVGMDDYISKPVSLQALEDICRRFFILNKPQNE